MNFNRTWADPSMSRFYPGAKHGLIRQLRKLQDLGKSFDVMVYPGAKHGLIRQHDGRHAYATIKRFFDENLQP